VSIDSYPVRGVHHPRRGAVLDPREADGPVRSLSSSCRVVCRSLRRREQAKASPPVRRVRHVIKERPFLCTSLSHESFRGSLPRQRTDHKTMLALASAPTMAFIAPVVAPRTSTIKMEAVECARSDDSPRITAYRS
jgi:hypothetical protein